MLPVHGAKGFANFSASLAMLPPTCPPVSLVWLPPTHRHSQYPCPEFDTAALLHNIWKACILKQRLIGASSEMHLFPAKVGEKGHRALYSTPECLFSSKCQWSSYNIEYQCKHSDEVEGALNWVDSLLALLGDFWSGDVLLCIRRISVCTVYEGIGLTDSLSIPKKERLRAFKPGRPQNISSK